jgi:aryl-alcohol dehydrogenase-like predicted oxidoreductase
MSSSSLIISFGTAGFGAKTPEDIEKHYEVLEKHNVKNLDSAQLYEGSEEALGKTKAGERFIIDTKWVGGFKGPGSMTKDYVINSAKESIQKLGVKQVGSSVFLFLDILT